MASQPDSKHVLFSASLGGTRDLSLNPGWATLEEEMATHSSTLAWRIPGAGEPGGCCLWGCTESDTTEVT